MNARPRISFAGLAWWLAIIGFTVSAASGAIRFPDSLAFLLIVPCVAGLLLLGRQP